MNKISINSSLIGQIYHRQEPVDFCARKLRALYIDKLYTRTPNANQLKGLVFEKRCICQTAYDESYDIPLKRLTKTQIKKNKEREQLGIEPIIGGQYVSYNRIDYQVMKFKELCEHYGIDIFPCNTQVLINKRFSDDVLCFGTLDIFPVVLKTRNNANQIAIIDLKLTGNISNSFGKYQWGEPQKRDPLQGYMYSWLVKDIDEELNPHLDFTLINPIKESLSNGNYIFYYWVFDYKTNPENKWVKSGFGTEEQLYLKEAIRKTISTLELCDKTGWQPFPLRSLCIDCPVSKLNGGTCIDYDIIESMNGA